MRRTIRACIAVDLLAQAEHDEAAQAILITDDAAFADAVAHAVARRAADPAARRHRRRELAGARRDHPGARLGRGGRRWSTAWRPEHLQLMLRRPGRAVRAQSAMPARCSSARFCPEAVGDYVAGPNHVLPTGRTARFASGLSVFDFLKRTTWVAADAAALAAIGPAAVALAEAEGLARARPQHRAPAGQAGRRPRCLTFPSPARSCSGRDIKQAA